MEYFKSPLFWFLILVNVSLILFPALLPSWINYSNTHSLHQATLLQCIQSLCDFFLRLYPKAVFVLDSDLTYTCRAFYIPSIYMPSFTKSMGTSSALPLGLYSAASIPSQILSGMASDYVDCSWILLMSCLTSSVNVFFVWGFCKNFTMFCAFCTICECLNWYLSFPQR
jgi:hypothetical protein